MNPPSKVLPPGWFDRLVPESLGNKTQRVAIAAQKIGVSEGAIHRWLRHQNVQGIAMAAPKLVDRIEQLTAGATSELDRVQHALELIWSYAETALVSNDFKDWKAYMVEVRARSKEALNILHVRPLTQKRVFRPFVAQIVRAGGFKGIDDKPTTTDGVFGFHQSEAEQLLSSKTLHYSGFEKQKLAPAEDDFLAFRDLPKK